MSRWHVAVAVLVFAIQTAEVEGISEPFDGRGAFCSVTGSHPGLHDPGWSIDGGFVQVEECFQLKWDRCSPPRVAPDSCN